MHKTKVYNLYFFCSSLILDIPNFLMELSSLKVDLNNLFIFYHRNTEFDGYFDDRNYKSRNYACSYFSCRGQVACTSNCEESSLVIQGGFYFVLLSCRCGPIVLAARIIRIH